MKPIKIVVWFGCACWLLGSISALYQRMIGNITTYEMVIIIIAFMVYIHVFGDDLKLN